MVELPLGSSPMPIRRNLHVGAGGTLEEVNQAVNSWSFLGTPSPVRESDLCNDGLGGELQKLEKMFR